MTEKTLFKRLAAGVGAVALAAVGFLGTNVAHAEGNTGESTPSVVNIDPAAKGSITVHKHVKDEASTDGAPKGEPLAGVEFTVYQVGNTSVDGQNPLNLATAEGWALAETAYTADVTVSPWTLTQVKQGVTADGTGTTPKGQVVFDDLAVGLYRVVETGSGSNLISEKAAPFLVAIPMPKEEGVWNYDVDVFPKNVLGSVTPTKTPNDPNNLVWVAGTSVSWDLNIPVPASDLPFTSFVITDTVVNGLSFDSWGDVKIGDTLLTAVTDYTVAGNVVTFTTGTGGGLEKLNANHTTAQTVTAVVNTTVLADPDGLLKNEVKVEINGTPGTGSATTNWGDIKLTKLSKDTETKLTGAVFDVYDAENGTKIGTLTDKGDGTYTAHIFVGNDNVISRTVWLKEVTAPSGHVLPANPWFGPYTINADKTTSTTVTVNNHKPTGPELPLTGSTGTWMMVLVGLGLVGASGAMFAARRTRTSH